jgi:aspartate carbamoyltransferase catalytic subunit
MNTKRLAMQQPQAIPHLLGIQGLKITDTHNLLESAASLIAFNRQPRARRDELKGVTLLNVFFENSTRTRTSFELAGKRLGADVVNIAIAQSSVAKGETITDTARTLMAMNPGFIVVRHSESGGVKIVADNVKASVINAGDGCHEHPTQALLDALTIRQHFGEFKGLNVAICGDILHSRVARSNLLLLNLLGAKLHLVGPSSLMPRGIETLAPCTIHTDMESGIKGADVIIMLRLQKERMAGGYVPSLSSYFDDFGLTHARMKLAAKNARVLHPGPMNRGIEITSSLADDLDLSLILSQVEHGVAMRQAILLWLAEARQKAGLL